MGVRLFNQLLELTKLLLVFFCHPICRTCIDVADGFAPVGQTQCTSGRRRHFKGLAAVQIGWGYCSTVIARTCQQLLHLCFVCFLFCCCHLSY
ncbi:hypothetical protein FKM82_025457 [Ascaphus truei]